MQFTYHLRFRKSRGAMGEKQKPIPFENRLYAYLNFFERPLLTPVLPLQGRALKRNSRML